VGRLPSNERAVSLTRDGDRLRARIFARESSATRHPSHRRQTAAPRASAGDRNRVVASTAVGQNVNKARHSRKSTRGRDAPPPRRLAPTATRQQPAPRLRPRGGAPPTRARVAQNDFDSTPHWGTHQAKLALNRKVAQMGRIVRPQARKVCPRTGDDPADSPGIRSAGAIAGNRTLASESNSRVRAGSPDEGVARGAGRHASIQAKRAELRSCS
jgi:hypothetical protein